MPLTSWTRVVAIVSVATFVPALPSHAETVSLPERKAGLWELKSSMDEGRGPREQSIKMCIDAAMEANTVKASLEDHKKNCEKYEVKKDAGKTLVDMRCTYNGRHVDSLTEMEGDFAKSFKVKIFSTTSDTRESTQQTVTVKRTILQDGTYLGENCGDLQPGEALAPDGSKVLVQ